MSLVRRFLGGLALFGASAVLAGAASAVDFTLTVTKAGSGAGTVTSNVGSIDCGVSCDDTYLDGTVITLAADPDAGSQFTGWLGPCTGAGTCQFAIDGDTNAVATFASPVVTTAMLDIDGNASLDALTDGLLVVRYLFGLSGDPLIDSAVGPGATRNTAPQIDNFLVDLRPALDVDGNGQADALTDGLLIIRYLFGLRGLSLTAGVVGGGATTPDIGARIESLLSDGIFVAADGSNADPGTKALPVRSITNGIVKAMAAGKFNVYISNGSYSETVTLNASNQGINLKGGYLRSSNWLHNGTRGVVNGPRTGALRINSVTAATTVEYLQFVGASATAPSSSSHAVVVTNSTGFRPRFLTAIAGNGTAGLQGPNAGAAGDDGGDGIVGANGYEDDSYFYCSGDKLNPPLAYAGGDSCVGAIISTRGGDGRRGCITNGANCAGVDGDAGSPNPAGSPSDPGIGVSGSVGGSGQPGQNGSTGTEGSAGSGGTITGSEWLPGNGGSGGRGGDGTGGGGGAGGGSSHSTGTCTDWGGGGGGGGGGGCGGTGGNGGTGGGASIAVLLINSSVTAVSVDVHTGSGGTGGSGRNGGNGGGGGLGRSGGGGYDEGRAGGAGGSGGSGARGGHGGGGAGGWVVGVYRSGSTWSDGGTTTATLGPAGGGGPSPGNDGAAGSSYVVY